MENNNITIRKVHLDTFIEILVELYNKGVDYIDITGVQDGAEDKMAISFTTDYMMDGAEENFKDVPLEGMDINELLNKKLSDEDLNQLI
jgi:hypothetical protein